MLVVLRRESAPVGQGEVDGFAAVEAVAEARVVGARQRDHELTRVLPRARHAHARSREQRRRRHRRLGRQRRSRAAARRARRRGAAGRGGKRRLERVRIGRRHAIPRLIKHIGPLSKCTWIITKQLL
jgi:hypothetical protein